MSESDDTDVLLLLPPDVFIVPSSESEDDRPGRTKPGVVSELIGHLQSLETRVSAIESKDNSLDTSLNNSLDLPRRSSFSSPKRHRQTLPKTKFSSSPEKPRPYSSVPSTPRAYLPSTNNRTNDTHHSLNSNFHPRKKHGGLISFSEPSMKLSASQNKELLHANRSPKKGTCSLLTHEFNATGNDFYTKPHKTSSKSFGNCTSSPNRVNSSWQLGQAYTKSRQVEDMNLSQVDELLQEMEATELELAKRISSTDSQNGLQHNSNHDHNTFRQGINDRHSTPHKRLNFEKEEKETSFYDSLLQYSPSKHAGDKFSDFSLPFDDTLQFIETERMLSEFKAWDQSAYNDIPNWKANVETKENEGTFNGTENKEVAENSHRNEVGQQIPKVNIDKEDKESLHAQSLPILNVDLALGSVNESEKSCAPVQLKQPDVTDLVTDKCKSFLSLGNLQNVKNEVQNINLNPFKVPEAPAEGCSLFGKSLFNSAQSQKDNARSVSHAKSTNHVSTNTETNQRKSQRLFTLSDFWDTNTNKSSEEMLRIKLEEEKFRREHCEFLIQELQKRLLEQQEKVAVAIRVDNDKNAVISQFQSSWVKLKDRWQSLESDHTKLQVAVKNLTEKHQSEISEFQAQIKRCESELSKSLDLASGYKEKSDSLVKERVDLLKSHADELESYKLLIQQAENRYEQMKGDCSKLLEKTRHTEETLKNVQQELNRERLKGGEVRAEMAVIHKALDSCEAELTVLRQEKESLQLKVREEQNRNTILDQKIVSLLTMIDDVKESKKQAKEEVKSLNQQQEKIRAELREVYQKQVDEVVKAKLQEFQTQLDTAEATFQTEFETRQRAIAECAARKIKSVIDKHQLEINLLEEKHKEEKRLHEIQLAQAMQKSSMLETQLNTQKTSKNQLAEQLHSVMQNQWQQALRIISGGNGDSISSHQRISAENFFEMKQPIKRETITNHLTAMHTEPMKLNSHPFSAGNFQGFQSQEEHNESLITLTSNDEMPVGNKKESKNDLRKYIKMILDMQQSRDEFTKAKFTENDMSPQSKNLPRKHYSKKELSILSEDSITWHPTSEPSIHDESEYMPIPQKIVAKTDQPKTKPPWK